MSEYNDALERAATLVELEYAPDAKAGKRLQQIAQHIRDLKRRLPIAKQEAPRLIDMRLSDALKAVDAPSKERICNFCGCYTNARMRTCCESGRREHARIGKGHP